MERIYNELGIKAKMQALVRNMGATAVHHLSGPEAHPVVPASITYYTSPGEEVQEDGLAA